MDEINLVKLTKDKEELFIKLNQESFQQAFEVYFGKTEEMVIPREDILSSLHHEGGEAYLVYQNEEVVGGVALVIDNKTNENDLHILFVNPSIQSKGLGLAIWNRVESLYPLTKIWRTCTPYFDRRNIHFYVNKCKFHVVEYINKYHPDPNTPSSFIGDGDSGMLNFEKIM